MDLKGQRRKDWRRHVPEAVAMMLPFSLFGERSDLCPDAMQRGLASQPEAGFVKAGIGL